MPPTIQLLDTAVRSLQSDMLSLLTRFVAFESYSGEDQPALDFIADAFAQSGLSLDYIPMASVEAFARDRRRNVVGMHTPRSDSGRSLLFNGHVDIVPTGPLSFWDSQPFIATVRDGWLHGRGAADMKAGIVCALMALQALKRLGVQPAGRIGFNAVVDEERGGDGSLVSARWLASHYDAVIIPEPFDETIAEAQVGVFWVTMDIRGVPSHASVTSKGSNAIEIAIAIFQELKLLEAEWNVDSFRHPLYRHLAHPINFNLGTMEGGEWTSSVPCRCTMTVRIGIYPGQSREEARKAVEERAQTAISHFSSQPTITFRYEGMQGDGAVFDLSAPALQALMAAHMSVHGEAPRCVSLTAATDARHFSVEGRMPVTCYGPVSERIHGINEAVSIESMLRVTTVFAKYMIDWCGWETTI
jgi:acetylornithine deacetylase